MAELSQQAGMELGVAAILEQLGLEGEHFRDTPRRFATALLEFHNPDTDFDAILKAGFEESQDNVLVVQTHIPFRGLCAHHLFPFFGEASIGYLPRQRVVGLSKLARVVDAAGTVAPSTQEHVTNLIADALHKSAELAPLGVMVTTRAFHGCMAVRGVKTPRAETSVNALRGLFRDAPALRSEYMELIRG